MIATGADDFMPDVLVRDVDAATLSKLKDRAKKNGRSLQNEIIRVITSVTGGEGLSDKETAARIRKLFRGRSFSDSAQMLREDRRR